MLLFTGVQNMTCQQEIAKRIEAEKSNVSDYLCYENTKALCSIVPDLNLKKMRILNGNKARA